MRPGGQAGREAEPGHGKWPLLADAWHIGFGHAIGGQGLPAQRIGDVAGPGPVRREAEDAAGCHQDARS